MFTDPIAQVLFTSPSTGQQWTFTAPDFPFLTGVTLAYEMARKATMQISFEAPYEEAIAKLLGRGSPFTLGTNLRARIGYASRPDWFTPWFGGFLAAGGDGLTLDPNGLSGQITAQVVAGGSGYTLISGAAVQDNNPRTMLEQCVAAMGLLPAVSPDASIRCAEAAAFTPGPSGAMWSPQAYAGLTAWEAVKRICGFLNLQYWIGRDVTNPRIDANTFYVASEREVSMGLICPQASTGAAADPATYPRPTFRLRGVIDLATSTFPCLTWAPEGGSASATWLAGADDQAGKGVFIGYIDTETGKVVEVTALPQDQEVATVGPVAAIQQDLKMANPSGGEDVGDAVKQDGMPSVYASAPMPGGVAGQQRAQQEANRRQALGNPAQQGVISSIGLPWLAPPMLINLAGAGDIYNGPYMIQKATHTWTGGTYDMSLTCLRQGAGIEPEGEKLQTPAGAMPE